MNAPRSTVTMGDWYAEEFTVGDPHGWRVLARVPGDLPQVVAIFCTERDAKLIAAAPLLARVADQLIAKWDARNATRAGFAPRLPPVKDSPTVELARLIMIKVRA